jgi:FkbM family methyltransferase
MHEGLREFIIGTLAKRDIGLMRYSRQRDLEACENSSHDLALLKEMPESQVVRLMKLLETSQSQFRQDLFVLSTLNFKTSGYFVEFGATDGVHLSNTLLLEREFEWTGILAEPALRWHDALRHNRNCKIDARCVWNKTGATLKFHEAEDSEFSAIDRYSRTGRNANKNGRDYSVDSISLMDLLDEHLAPRRIDYLSMDTEGSEYEILSAFNFDKYDIRIVTIEHNYQPVREKIFELMTSKGYERRFEQVSLIDDWYVRI